MGYRFFTVMYILFASILYEYDLGSYSELLTARIDRNTYFASNQNNSID